jgi:hypothetical protein
MKSVGGRIRLAATLVAMAIRALGGAIRGTAAVLTLASATAVTLARSTSITS